MPKNIKLILTVAAAVLVVWFLYDAFSQPGVSNLKGGFEEVAFYRNENNTGPIIRIYAVTVAGPETAEMEAYGNFMPHTKYGNTKVYFFRKDKPAPDNVYPGEENFEPAFKSNLVAVYEKDAMGQVRFRRS